MTALCLAQTRLALIGLGRSIYRYPRPWPLRIVYNGEVYNFPSRRELQPEALSHFGPTPRWSGAWIRWGTRAVTRFNGMFAFLSGLARSCGFPRAIRWASAIFLSLGGTV